MGACLPSQTHPDLSEGEQVEVFYRAAQTWHDAIIERDNGDGTFIINVLDRNYFGDRVKEAKDIRRKEAVYSSVGARLIGSWSLCRLRLSHACLIAAAVLVLQGLAFVVHNRTLPLVLMQQASKDAQLHRTEDYPETQQASGIPQLRTSTLANQAILFLVSVTGDSPKSSFVGPRSWMRSVCYPDRALFVCSAADCRKDPALDQLLLAPDLMQDMNRTNARARLHLAELWGISWVHDNINHMHSGYNKSVEMGHESSGERPLSNEMLQYGFRLAVRPYDWCVLVDDTTPVNQTFVLSLVQGHNADNAYVLKSSRERMLLISRGAVQKLMRDFWSTILPLVRSTALTADPENSWLEYAREQWSLHVEHLNRSIPGGVPALTVPRRGETLRTPPGGSKLFIVMAGPGKMTGKAQASWVKHVQWPDRVIFVCGEYCRRDNRLEHAVVAPNLLRRPCTKSGPFQAWKPHKDGTCRSVDYRQAQFRGPWAVQWAWDNIRRLGAAGRFDAHGLRLALAPFAWWMIVDDNTFVNLPKLEKVFSRYNPNEKLLIACEKIYGGSGMAASSALAADFATTFWDQGNYYDAHKDDPHFYYDQIYAGFLKDQFHARMVGLKELSEYEPFNSKMCLKKWKPFIATWHLAGTIGTDVEMQCIYNSPMQPQPCLRCAGSVVCS